MGTPDSEIDATTEINIDPFVFRLSASPRFCIHYLDKFLELTVNANDRLEIQPATFESVEIERFVGNRQTHASFTNAIQSPEWTMPRRAFSNMLSA